MSGAKIIEGLKDAVAGNFARVTIEGQTWERVDEIRSLAKSRVKLLNEISEMVIAGLDDGLSAKEIAGNIEVVLESRALQGDNQT